MTRLTFRAIVSCLGATVLLTQTGCIDAIREGFTSGLESGISGAMEALVQGLLGLFFPA